MEIRPITKEEQKYACMQGRQLTVQTGCIGHLSAGFGSSGNSFSPVWEDRGKDLKTEAFQAELDGVIHALRSDDTYGGLLRNRRGMLSYCRSQPESRMKINTRNEYGFRVDTDDYTYMLRVCPGKVHRNLDCYCYQRQRLERHIERARKGIRFITPHYDERFRIPDGDSIRIYSPDGEWKDRVCRYIDDYHAEIVGFWEEPLHICKFSEIMRRKNNIVIPLRSSLPEKCFSVLESTGQMIILERGKKGYQPAGTCIGGMTGRERADLENEIRGITRAQEAAMAAGAMSGWELPAADPENYDGNGIFRHVKQRGREGER